MNTKKLLFSLAFALIGFLGWGQTIIFTENMYNGSGGSSGNAISVHESNNRFNEDGLTYSGTGDMRTTTPSSGYTGTSGTWNVMLNASGETFIIDGINASAYTSLVLSFGNRKGTTAENGTGIVVEYSTTGTSGSYTAITFPNLPTGTGTAIYYLRTSSSTIPNTVTTIRFRSTNAVEWRIDDVLLEGSASGTPTITLADNGTQVAAANVTQGSTAHTLHKFSLAVTTADATLTGVQVTTAGTYVSTDLTNLKVRYSTDATLDAGDATLSTYTSVPTAGTLTFPSFTSQPISSGSTGYIFITADVAGSAVAGHTISVNAVTTDELTFSMGTKSGSTNNGGAQTITAATPSITLADNGTQVAAANVTQGSNAHTLHKFSLAVTTADATLTGVQVTTAGTYVSADLTNLKVRYSTDATLDAGDATLSTYTSVPTAGTLTFPSFTSQAINSGSSGYIFITADVAGSAVAGHTISVNAVTTGELTFSSGTKSGSTTAGGVQTVSAGGATTCIDESFTGWTHAYGDWSHDSNGTWNAIGTYAGSNQIQMNDVGDWLELPLLNNPMNLQYSGALSSTESVINGNRIKVQYYNGSAWIDVIEHTSTSTAFITYTADLSDYSSLSNVRIRLYRSADNRSHYIDDIVVTCGTSPIVSVTPSTLTSFTYVQGSGPSTSQSFSLSGTDLTGYPGNITVAGSTNYEVSLDNSTFSSSVSVPFTSATLSATTIYVRLKAGLTAGDYNSESISISGGGDTNGASVVCSGNVTILVSEINLKGNGNSIANGDVSPQGTDHTSFGTAIVGSTTIDRTFTIENTGTAVLNLTGSIPDYVTISGANASDFTVFTQPTTPIAATSSTTFVVSFNPTAAGTRLATVNIINDDSDENPYTFAIQGTGSVTSEIDMKVKGNGNTIADNDIYPQGTDYTAFGTADLGNTIDRTFTIVNDGTANLNLTGSPIVRITGANASYFSVIAQPSITTLSGSSSTTFDVRFTASAIGTKTANIEIESNDPDNAVYNFYINGTGKGTEDIYVYGQNGENIPEGSSASSLNHTHFGGVAITGGMEQKVFTIFNYSGSTISVNNLALSGTHAALFSITSYPNANAISDGNSTQFSILFDPDTVGEKEATVTFNTTLTSPDDVFSFEIGGTGIDFTPCTLSAVETIAQQDFEDVPATPTWSYTATNTGGTISVAGGTFNNGSGAKDAFIGGKSFQFKGTDSETGPYEYAEMVLDPVNTSEYENIILSMRIGAFRASGSTQGLDVNDIVYIQTSVDGGVNWSTEAVLGGYSNSRWDFSATGVFNAFYSGNNVAPKVDTRDGDAELSGSDGISYIYLKDLPTVNSLSIKILIDIDRVDELYALDNITLTGQKPEIVKWITTAGGSWQGGLTPAAGKKVIFDDDFDTTTDGDVTACSCQVNANKTIHVRNGDYLFIASDILNEGTIIVENEGQIVQSNDNAIISDLGTYQVYKTTGSYYNYDYIYWSSPVEDLNIQNVFANADGFNNFKYKFVPQNYNDTKSGINAGSGQPNANADGFDDEGNDWALYNSGVMQAGLGYIVMGKNSPSSFSSSNINTPHTSYTVNYTGQKVNNGSIDVTLYEDKYNLDGGTVPNAHNINLNLVGNPYPSAISTGELYKDNASIIEPNFYFWTHAQPISNAFTGPWGYNFSNNSFASATVDTGTYAVTTNALNTGLSGLDFTYIASGQAFFVQAQDDISSGTTQLNFNNSMRGATHTNTSFLRMQNANEESLNRIWLSLTETNGDKNPIVLGFSTSNADGLSANDVYRIDSGNDTEFYSLIPEVLGDFDIQFLSEFSDDKTIPLGMEIRAAGSYAIQIEQTEGVFVAGQKIYLEDTYLDIIHEMGMGPYTFTQTVGENINDRFILRFTNSVLGNEETVFNQVKVYPNPSTGMFNIAYYGSETLQYTIYDLTGKMVMTGNGNQINLSQQAIGLYVAKITDGTAVRTLKLMRE